MKNGILILVAIIGFFTACTSKEETPKVSEGKQIMEDLNWRYTAKAYDKTKRISPEDLNVIKETLRLSPSSINSQPWKFIIIDSDEAKQRLSKTFKGGGSNQSHTINASQLILFAHKLHFDRTDYKKRLDANVAAGRLSKKGYDKKMNNMSFAEKMADENGYNGNWTKAQSYIALGNVLHTVARLKIDATPMEGIDIDAIKKEFAKELGDDYACTFVLALGYHDGENDYNRKLPKARLSQEEIFITL